MLLELEIAGQLLEVVRLVAISQRYASRLNLVKIQQA